MENEIGGRVTTSLKDLMDYGDTIRRLYADFITDVKGSKMVQPSLDSFGPIIEEVVKTIKSSPHFDSRMY